MTLSSPSCLAAFTSASMPPRSAAEVAVAALPPPLEPLDALLSDGGAHAASAITLSAATSETRTVLLAMTATSTDETTRRGSAPPGVHPRTTWAADHLFAT